VKSSVRRFTFSRSSTPVFGSAVAFFIGSALLEAVGLVFPQVGKFIPNALATL
jgi:hypothetical protein